MGHVAAQVGMFAGIQCGPIGTGNLRGDAVNCTVVLFNREERHRPRRGMHPRAPPACQGRGLGIRIGMGRQSDQGPIAEKARGCHSRARSTWAGLADKGPRAKARPASMVAPMPPRMISPAEDQIGV